MLLSSKELKVGDIIIGYKNTDMPYYEDILDIEYYTHRETPLIEVRFRDISGNIRYFTDIFDDRKINKVARGVKLIK